LGRPPENQELAAFLKDRGGDPMEVHHYVGGLHGNVSRNHGELQLYSCPYTLYCQIFVPAQRLLFMLGAICSKKNLGEHHAI
jgi:hypothetical protein